MATYKFRNYKGVRYVAPHRTAPDNFTRCGECGRAWDDSKSTGLTPTPAGRCPFEYWHRARPDYVIEPEAYAGESVSSGGTGRHSLSFRGNWLGTYNSKRQALRARRDHNAARKSQHELAQARVRDIDAGKCS